MPRKHRKHRTTESGFTLIELLLAMIMLMVGLLGSALLITSAIAANNRTKLDSSGTMLAEMVIDTVSANTAGTAQTLTDCNPAGGVNWPVNTAAGGATLVAATGAIDFNSQAYAAVPAGYAMRYVTCGAAGQQSTYDVRWNVQAFAGGRLITVAARQMATTNQ